MVKVRFFSINPASTRQAWAQSRSHAMTTSVPAGSSTIPLSAPSAFIAWDDFGVRTKNAPAQPIAKPQRPIPAPNPHLGTTPAGGIGKSNSGRLLATWRLMMNQMIAASTSDASLAFQLCRSSLRRFFHEKK